MTSVTWSVSLGGDGSTVDDTADPNTGLDNYGYASRLVPAFSNLLNVATYTQGRAVAAAASAVDASNYAASALNAPGTNATSTTSVAIANSVDKTFVIQTGKAYVTGQTLNAASAANPANYMAGQVKTYNSGTGSLVIAVSQIGGSGTFADWVISMAAIVSSTLPSRTGNGGKFLTTNGTSAESWAAAVIPSNNGSDFTNMTTFRSNVGLAIGSNVQAYDAGLQSIAGLTTAADKMIYTTASDTYATTDLTSFARTLLDDGSAAAMKTTLGLVIGTDVQAYNGNLAAIAGLGFTADKIIFSTGPGAVALQTLTGFARTLLDDSDAAAMRTTIDAAKRGANTDITSLALTTPLPTSQGGTGSNFADLAALLAGLPVTGGYSGEGRIGTLQFKWGVASVTSASSGTTGEATVTYTTPFSTGTAGVWVTPDLNAGAIGGTNYAPYVRSTSAGSVIIGLDNSGTPNNSYSCYWLAIGF